MIPLIGRLLLGALMALWPSRVGAQRALSDGVKELSTQIAASVTTEKKTRIAVIPFRELNGKPTVLGTYLAEELVTNLFQTGKLDIVERTMLDKILQELKLAESAMIDPSSAKEVGRIAGVDAIVTGTITDLQSFVAVNCRLIDAQSGRVFAAAQTKIIKDDDVRRIMGVAIQRGPSGGPGPEGADPEAAIPSGAASTGEISPGPPAFETEYFRLVVESTRKTTSNAVVLDAVFESVRTEMVNVYAIYNDKCFYLLDQNGERWNQAECDRGFPKIEIPPGTRVKRTLMFKSGGSKTGNTFSLVGTLRVGIGRRMKDMQMTIAGLTAQ